MKERISLEEARAEILAHLTPMGEETVPLDQGLGRTLSRDLTAPYSQPPFPRAPVDGYALRARDTLGASPDTPVRLDVADTVYAGDVAAVPLGPGQAVRVMTGAMLPEGCDCVIRQEDTDLGSPRVSIRRPLVPFENYVPMGSDFPAGSLLLPAGTRLDAAALGVLASGGYAEIPVFQRPAVGVLTTGDEVVAPGTRPLPPGKIYGSNGVLLAARLRELGLPDVRLRHAPDDPAQVARAIRELLAVCSCVITTGGVSVGERDIFHQALPLLGARRLFWRVKVKPGTPAMFSLWEGKPILSLSGNPFAALATFELLARPMLAALCRQSALDLRKGQAVLGDPFPKESRTRRFLRGRLEDGRVHLPSDHSSGALFSLLGCHCLAEIPAGSPPLPAGTPVTIYL